MALDIPIKQSGDELSAQELNRIVSAIQSLESKPSSGMYCRIIPSVEEYHSISPKDDNTLYVIKTGDIIECSYLGHTLFTGNQVVSEKDDFVFLQIADTHMNPASIKKCVELMSSGTGIDCTVLAGDIQLREAMKTSILSSAKPFMCIAGNHDAHDEGLTQSQLKVQLIDTFQGINHVVSGSDTSGYWHKDFNVKDHHIRVIGFNEYEYESVGPPSAYNDAIVYSQAQMDWFINLLKNTPDDTFIILVHHMPCGNLRNADNTGKFTSGLAPSNYEFNGTDKGVLPALIPKIVRAYQTGENISGFVTPTGSSGINLTLNTSFSKASINKILHVGGHTHWDVTEYLPDYPEQLQVIIDQGRPDKYKYSDLSRSASGEASYCINKISLDFINEKVKITRIGAHTTDSGANRDYIEFPFSRVLPVSMQALPIDVVTGFNKQIILTPVPSHALLGAVTYSSHNTSIATVDKNGQITGVTAGTTTITLTSVEFGFTCNVSVTVRASSEIIPVTDVVLNKSTLTLDRGSMFNLTASVLPADATISGVSWSSSDTGVASVDANGQVSAVAGGQCTITATSHNNVSSHCTISVTAAEIDTSTTAFINRVLADGGILLIENPSALQERINEDRALVGSNNIAIDYLGYKIGDDGKVSKLYSLNGAYDCTDVYNLKVVNKSFVSAAVDSALYAAKASYATSLTGKKFKRVYYKGGLLNSTANQKENMMLVNILGSGVDNITGPFLMSDKLNIQMKQELASVRAASVTLTPGGKDETQSIHEIYLEVNPDATNISNYVVSSKFDNRELVLGAGVDYWQGGLAGLSYIKMTRNFDRVIVADPI